VLRKGANGANGARREHATGWAFDAAAVAVAKDLTAEDLLIAEGGAAALHALRGALANNGRRSHAGEPAFAPALERAVGAALAHKTKKSGRVAVVFGGGDGGVWDETLEIARAHGLPMIFVSDARETEQRGKRKGRAHEPAELEPGTELPHIVVDGNDVVAAYRVAHEAIDRARRGRGPTLIECIAFRVAERRQQDCVASMEHYLRGKGLMRRGLKQELLETMARQSKRGKPDRNGSVGQF